MISLNVGALAPVLAIGLLVGGTFVFCVAAAAAARAVDRLWDLVSPPDNGGRERMSPRTGSSGVRRRPWSGVPRTILATILAGVLLAALGWLSFVLGRARDLV